ncbi:MAG: phosphatase PAP2 family protein [Spirochaetota bacterium]
MSVAPSPQLSRLYRGVLAIALLALPVVFIYNIELFAWLNCRKDATVLNFFFLTLTSLADGLWIMMLATVVQSFAPRNFKAFLIALVLGNIVLQSTKYFVDADRPLRLLGESAICLLGQPLTVRSFPSGHAFSVGLLFMFLRPRHSWVGAFALLVVATLAAVSRAYVGVHFPRDIASGFLLAVLSFLGAELLSKKITFRETSLTLRKGLVAFLGIGTALLYIFAYHEKTKELEPLLTPAAWLVVLYWCLYAVRLLVRGFR